MKISGMIFLVPDTQLSSPCFTMQDLTSISEKNTLVYAVSPDTATKVPHLVLLPTNVKLLFWCYSKFVNIFKCPVFQILRCLITTVKYSHLLDTLLVAQATMSTTSALSACPSPFNGDWTMAPSPTNKKKSFEFWFAFKPCAYTCK